MLCGDVPKDELCINGRFAYTINHKSLKSGPVKQGHIDNQRRLCARFCVKGFQEAIGASASEQTSQLRSLRVFYKP